MFCCVYSNNVKLFYLFVFWHGYAAMYMSMLNDISVVFTCIVTAICLICIVVLGLYAECNRHAVAGIFVQGHMLVK